MFDLDRLFLAVMFNNRSAALQYHAEGLSVIPIEPSGKKPLVQWRRYQETPANEKQIRSWWTEWPYARIGIVTGAVSGLIGIDVDDADPECLEEVQRLLGPAGRIARTPRGAHLLYRDDGTGLRSRTRIEPFQFPVDIRAEGGYLIVSPSTGYTWVKTAPFDSLATLQASVIASTSADPPSVVESHDLIHEGERNDALTSFAGTMRRCGMTAPEIEPALSAINEHRCIPPLPEADVHKITASVGRYPPGAPVTLGQHAPPSSPHPRPRLLTNEEFEMDTLPETIVEGMIYRSSTHLLTGAAKTGKSWLAYQLGMAVSAGQPFLGMQTRQSSVLILSLEMSAAMVRERMQSLAGDVGLPMPKIPIRFNVVAPTQDDVPFLDLGSEQGRMYLKELIAQADADLVILDTLFRFLPGLDPLSNQEMGPVFGNLNAVAQSTGAAIMSLDHTAKGLQTGPVAHSGLGAQVKGGASRVIIRLTRTGSGRNAKWCTDVESHFGGWEEPLYYQRPLRADGTVGEGCVRIGASAAFEITYERLQKLFEDFGEAEDGHLQIRSKRKMIEAMKESGWTSSNSTAGMRVEAILRDFVRPAANDDPTRPIVTSKGSKNAVIFTWIPQEEA